MHDDSHEGKASRISIFMLTSFGLSQSKNIIVTSSSRTNQKSSTGDLLINHNPTDDVNHGKNYPARK